MKLDLSEQSGDGIMVPISLAFYSHYNGNTLGYKLFIHVTLMKGQAKWAKEN